MTGPFAFFDVRTADVAVTRNFYTTLFGWSVADVPVGEKSIPMLMGPDGPWGGFTELPEGDERPPQWIPYVRVDNVDATTEKAVEMGATIVRPRTELPPGPVVVIKDPTGATLVLFEPRGE